MSAGKTQIQGITFHGQELECVRSYKYLGLIISSEGSMKKMEVERVTKAKRASFALRQEISTTHNVSVKLHMSLFDKQIEPILLYGCPIWGMPSSNCTVKVKGDCLNNTRLKDNLHNLFEHLGHANINIISCRFHKKEEVAFVTLGNILDKINLLSLHNKSPVTFTIEGVEKGPESAVETFYSTSCKYALGISKYSSTTLALGELKRYPIQHRVVLLTMLYWLRLEHNTKKTLLNLAFQTIKKENHQWLKNIEYYLWKIGYRNVWENPKGWKKTSFKLAIARRLKDMYTQHFHNFRTDDINLNKCVITNTCVQSIYGENKYLYQINSPKIRTIFTKLIVDSNCTRESRYRSYRGKKSENNLCPHCNVPQDVLHVLIHCDYPAVKRKRESFLSQYCTYARNYATKSETVQIRELLNIDPQCHEEDKPLAQNIICSFVNHVYNIVNTSLSE